MIDCVVCQLTERCTRINSLLPRIADLTRQLDKPERGLGQASQEWPVVTLLRVDQIGKQAIDISDSGYQELLDWCIQAEAELAVKQQQVNDLSHTLERLWSSATVEPSAVCFSSEVHKLMAGKPLHEQGSVLQSLLDQRHQQDGCQAEEPAPAELETADCPDGAHTIQFGTLPGVTQFSLADGIRKLHSVNTRWQFHAVEPERPLSTLLTRDLLLSCLDHLFPKPIWTAECSDDHLDEVGPLGPLDRNEPRHLDGAGVMQFHEALSALQRVCMTCR